LGPATARLSSAACASTSSVTQGADMRAAPPLNVRGPAARPAAPASRISRMQCSSGGVPTLWPVTSCRLARCDSTEPF
jgi:hypothetical protein